MNSAILQLYFENLIPAPHESEQDFFARVEEVRAIRKDPKKITDHPIEEIDHLMIFRSNRKLPFWTGALTWLYTLDSGITIPIVQLPKAPRKFSLAKEEELLAHEKIHTMRAAFKEPRFEEILAYQTSPSLVRRFFGPLFQSTKEPILFFILLAATCLFTIPWLPLPFLGFLLFRLIYRQRQFQLAKRQLAKRCTNYQMILPILSDDEIIALAKGRDSFLEEETLRMKLVKLLRKQLTNAPDARYLEEKT